MPRQGRLHLPGGYYHVMGRGRERCRVFESNIDKKDFLGRLGEGLEQTQCQCYAWVLLSNHYHLLIRVSSKPLSKLMSPLLSGYGTHYNIRKKRSGNVFQNRFKSILFDADNYLLELIRYIHLNPLKAKMVGSLSALDRYSWCGHAGVMGNASHKWYSTGEVLGLFGKQKKTARSRYRQFVNEGLKGVKTQDLSGGGLIRSYGGWEAVQRLRKKQEARIGDERILGDSAFVESVLKMDKLPLNQKTHWQRKGWNLAKLINKVCIYIDISPKDIIKKGRENDISDAKSLICFWGTQVLGLSSTAIAINLNIGQSSISKASKRGEIYCQQHGVEWKKFSSR